MMVQDFTPCRVGDVDVLKESGEVRLVTLGRITGGVKVERTIPMTRFTVHGHMGRNALSERGHIGHVDAHSATAIDHPVHSPHRRHLATYGHRLAASGLHHLTTSEHLATHGHLPARSHRSGSPASPLVDPEIERFLVTAYPEERHASDEQKSSIPHGSP
jgi:hypothetical protein